MTGNQTMDYYVQPRHIYSHSRTCTCKGLHKRPSNLVAFNICYLLDCANIHEILALMIMILVFPVYIRYLHPLWISCSLYIVRGDDHMWHMSIMPIHGHCTLMYTGLLQFIFAVACWDISLYCTNEWLVFPPRYSLRRPQTLGGICYSRFYQTW